MLELEGKEVNINQMEILDKSYEVFTSAIWPFRKKLVFSQFASKKPILDIVRENEKYYGLDDLRSEEEFPKLEKLLISQFESKIMPTGLSS